MKKQNLNNINIYSRENINCLVTKNNFNQAQLTIVEVINKINEYEPRSIINYPSNSNNIFNLLNPDSQELFLGIDYRLGFIENSKAIDETKFIFKPKTQELEISKCDLLISDNFIESSLDPVEEIQENIKRMNPKKVIFITEFSSESKNNLDSEHNIISLSNDSRFINNIYSKKTIEKIAKKFDLSIEFIKEEDNKEFAIIFGEIKSNNSTQEKEIKKVVSKKNSKKSKSEKK